MAAMQDREVLQAFIRFADHLVDDYDILDLTTQLTEDCARLLDVAAAGLLLADPAGIMHLLAATSEQARIVEAFQLQRDEGPCLDCFHTGQLVKVADLRTESRRWPRFVAVAAEQGFSSVHAIPLRLGPDRLGALGLFGTTTGALDDDDLTLAQALAHVASIAIAQLSQPRERANLLPGLRTAVAGRALLEVAKGVLAETHTLDMQEAFSRLRSYAHRHQLRLTDLARTVVAGEPHTRQVLLAELGNPTLSGSDSGA